MSDSNDDELRLLSLTAAFACVAEPALSLEQVFDLATKGDLHLYAKLPVDMVVHVDSSLPIVTYNKAMGPRPSEAVAISRYSLHSLSIHSEVTHVALNPYQTEVLKLVSATDAMAFTAGIRPHPDNDLAQAGWMIPCQFDGPLVTCPTSPRREVEKRSGRVRAQVLKVTLDDIQVNERILDLLNGTLRSFTDVPHFLRGRAYGVYILYCAARQHYAALKVRAIDIDEVESEVLKRLPSLGATRVAHVVKLISPKHRRNSGVEEDDQVVFGADVLRRPTFRRKYLEVDFMTEALSLVLHVTEQWLDAKIEYKRASSTWTQDREYLEAHFAAVGFYGKESKALARLALWPRKG